MFIDRVRPPEWMHERRCLARAIISAVENLRDSDAFTDLGFRLQMQDNHALTEADDYLNTGMVDCICTAPWPEDEADLAEEVRSNPTCWTHVVARMNKEMHGEHEFLVP